MKKMATEAEIIPEPIALVKTEEESKHLTLELCEKVVEFLPGELKKFQGELPQPDETDECLAKVETMEGDSNIGVETAKIVSEGNLEVSKGESFLISPEISKVAYETCGTSEHVEVDDTPFKAEKIPEDEEKMANNKKFQLDKEAGIEENVAKEATDENVDKIESNKQALGIQEASLELGKQALIDTHDPAIDSSKKANEMVTEVSNSNLVQEELEEKSFKEVKDTEPEKLPALVGKEEGTEATELIEISVSEKDQIVSDSIGETLKSTVAESSEIKDHETTSEIIEVKELCNPNEEVARVQEPAPEVDEKIEEVSSIIIEDKSQVTIESTEEVKDITGETDGIEDKNVLDASSVMKTEELCLQEVENIKTETTIEESPTEEGGRSEIIDKDYANSESENIGVEVKVEQATDQEPIMTEASDEMKMDEEPTVPMIEGNISEVDNIDDVQQSQEGKPENEDIMKESFQREYESEKEKPSCALNAVDEDANTAISSETAETSTGIKEVTSVKDQEEIFNGKGMEDTPKNTDAVSKDAESEEKDHHIEGNENTEILEVPNMDVDQLHVADSLVGQSVEKGEEKQYELSDFQPEEQVHEANVASKEKEEDSDDVSDALQSINITNSEYILTEAAAAAATTYLKSETSEIDKENARDVYLVDPEKCSEKPEPVNAMKVEDNSKQEETKEVCEGPESVIKEECDIIDESMKSTEEEMNESFQEKEKEKEGAPEVEVCEKQEISTVAYAEKQILEEEGTNTDQTSLLAETTEEKLKEENTGAIMSIKEACKESETASSGTGKENPEMQEHPIADLSNSYISDETVKESIKEDESSSTKLVEASNSNVDETDTTEQSTHKNLEETTEPKNDPSLLGIEKDSKEEITALESKEDPVCSSSFELEVSKKESEEETLVEGSITTAHSGSASPEAEMEETNMKEAELEEEKKDINNVLAFEESSLATTEHEGVSVDGADIDVKPVDSSTLCKKVKETPQEDDQMQDKGHADHSIEELNLDTGEEKRVKVKEIADQDSSLEEKCGSIEETSHSQEAEHEGTKTYANADNMDSDKPVLGIEEANVELKKQAVIGTPDPTTDSLEEANETVTEASNSNLDQEELEEKSLKEVRDIEPEKLPALVAKEDTTATEHIEISGSEKDQIISDSIGDTSTSALAETSEIKDHETTSETSEVSKKELCKTYEEVARVHKPVPEVHEKLEEVSSIIIEDKSQATIESTKEIKDKTGENDGIQDKNVLDASSVMKADELCLQEVDNIASDIRTETDIEESPTEESEQSEISDKMEQDLGTSSDKCKDCANSESENVGVEAEIVQTTDKELSITEASDEMKRNEEPTVPTPEADISEVENIDVVQQSQEGKPENEEILKESFQQENEPEEEKPSCPLNAVDEEASTAISSENAGTSTVIKEATSVKDKEERLEGEGMEDTAMNTEAASRDAESEEKDQQTEVHENTETLEVEIANKNADDLHVADSLLGQSVSDFQPEERVHEANGASKEEEEKRNDVSEVLESTSSTNSQHIVTETTAATDLKSETSEMDKVCEGPESIIKEECAIIIDESVKSNEEEMQESFQEDEKEEILEEEVCEKLEINAVQDAEKQFLEEEETKKDKTTLLTETMEEKPREENTGAITTDLKSETSEIDKENARDVYLIDSEKCSEKPELDNAMKIEDNSKQEETKEVCEGPESVIKEECNIIDESMKSNEEQINESFEEKEGAPEVEVCEKLEISTVADAEKQILEEEGTDRDQSSLLAETMEEKSKEENTGAIMSIKEACKESETASSGTGKENPEMQEHPIADLSNSYICDETVKESIKEDESSSMKLVEASNSNVEETDTTEQSTHQNLEEMTEPNNDPSLLGIEKDSKEEITALESKEDPVCSSSFELEVSKKESEEETLVEGSITTADSGSASPDAEMEETNMKEAELDEEKKDINNVLAFDESSLATTEHEGVSVDSADIDVKPVDSSTLCEKVKETPQEDDQMQDKGHADHSIEELNLDTGEEKRVEVKEIADQDSSLEEKCGSIEETSHSQEDEHEGTKTYENADNMESDKAVLGKEEANVELKKQAIIGTPDSTIDSLEEANETVTEASNSNLVQEELEEKSLKEVRDVEPEKLPALVAKEEDTTATEHIEISGSEKDQIISDSIGDTSTSALAETFEIKDHETTSETSEVSKKELCKTYEEVASVHEPVPEAHVKLEEVSSIIIEDKSQATIESTKEIKDMTGENDGIQDKNVLDASSVMKADELCLQEVDNIASDIRTETDIEESPTEESEQCEIIDKTEQDLGTSSDKCKDCANSESENVGVEVEIVQTTDKELSITEASDEMKRNEEPTAPTPEADISEVENIDIVQQSQEGKPENEEILKESFQQENEPEKEKPSCPLNAVDEEANTAISSENAGTSTVIKEATSIKDKEERLEEEGMEDTPMNTDAVSSDAESDEKDQQTEVHENTETLDVEIADKNADDLHVADSLLGQSVSDFQPEERVHEANGASKEEEEESNDVSEVLESTSNTNSQNIVTETTDLKSETSEMDKERVKDVYLLDCKTCLQRNEALENKQEGTQKELEDSTAEKPEPKDAKEDIEDNLKQEESKEVCEGPESITEEECAITIDESMKSNKEEMQESFQEDEKEEIPEEEVCENLEINVVQDADKQFLEEEETKKDKTTLSTETMEEKPKEENTGAIMSIEEVRKESETVASGTGKENSEMEEHPIADISKSSISDETVKEGINEDESSSLKFVEEASDSNIEEKDSTDQTTEPNNDPSLLDIEKDSKKEITELEAKEDAVHASSFELEESKKDTEEETSVKETISTDDLGSASPAAEMEETNIKEAEPEEKKEEINDVLVVEENGLATTGHEGIGVNSVDIDVKEVDSSISCGKMKGIPQEEDVMQDKVPDTGSEDQMETATMETLGDAVKEYSNMPSEEYEPTTMEEGKITDETSEKDHAIDEHSETPVLQATTDEISIQKEDNPTLDVPAAEPEDTEKESGQEVKEHFAEEQYAHTEQESGKCSFVSEVINVSNGEEPRELENESDACKAKTLQDEKSSGISLEREKVEDGKPLDEASDVGETSGTSIDRENAIQEEENLAKNLAKPESLKEDTELPREAHDQIPEVINVNDNAKNVGQTPADFEEKPEFDSETVVEDQIKETFSEASKSLADETSTDAQNQETEKQILEELEDNVDKEDHVNKEQNENEVTKAVILSEEVDKEVEKADGSEDIKEHVIEEESSTNEPHLEAKGDETTNKVEDTSVSTECLKEADSSEQIETRESEVEEHTKDQTILLTETKEDNSKEKNTSEIEQKIEDDSKAANNFEISTLATDKEDSLEKENKKREPGKEASEESETAASGTGKENSEMEEHPIADISNSSISDETVKAGIKEDESSSLKLVEEASDSNIEEKDSTEQTTEPNNDPSLLDTEKDSKEEIAELEAKEDTVRTSSFELKESKKDTEEETSVKETVNTADLGSASPAAEMQETNLEEAEPEEKKEEINDVLAVEENGKATTGHEGIGVDSVDIVVKEVDSSTSCGKMKGFPQEEDVMQDKVPNTGSEDQMETATIETLGDAVKEYSNMPSEEYEPTTMEEGKITDETSEKDHAPDEHSETPVSQATTDEISIQKEDNPTLDVPAAEPEDTEKESVKEVKEHFAEEPYAHTEQESGKCSFVSEVINVSNGEEPRELENESDACKEKTLQDEKSSGISLEKEKVEDGKPLGEASDVGETSGTSIDRENAIQEEENLAKNSAKPESLKEDTELPREAHDQIPEVINMNDNAKNVGQTPADFEEKPEFDSETVVEDQSKEAFSEASKSLADETSTDVQNQETEKQILEELEDNVDKEDLVNKEQNENEVTKAVILSGEVDKEVEKADGSEDIKEHVIEEESSTNEPHLEAKGDETTNEVEDTSVSTECLKEADSSEQIETRESEVEEPTKGQTILLTETMEDNSKEENTSEIEQEIEDDSKAANNFEVSTLATDKEDSLEKENEKREPGKEVSEESETAASGTGKDNPETEEYPIADISNPSISDEIMKESVKEDESSPVKLIQEACNSNIEGTDSTEETTLKKLEETEEPNNDPSLLDIEKESKEEITALEAKEDLVSSSSFELEESRKDTEEEASIKGTIDTADLGSASLAVETEEINVKEAEPEEKKDISNVLADDKNSLGTTEHEGVIVANADIDVKPVDSTLCKKVKEIPQEEDGMQDKKPNTGSEDQIEMATREIPFEEVLGDADKECTNMPADEPTPMEERKITDETSEKDHAPDEHSEIPVPQATDEILIQEEDNSTLDAPERKSEAAEKESGHEVEENLAKEPYGCTEQESGKSSSVSEVINVSNVEEPGELENESDACKAKALQDELISDIGLEREKVEDGKPLDEVTEAGETSYTYKDREKEIQEENLAKSLAKSESLKEDTEVEKEDTELPRQAEDQIPEVTDVNDDAKDMELAQPGFVEKLISDSETLVEDRSMETVPEAGKSLADETSTDVQNQEVEKQTTEEPEDKMDNEDHVNKEENANEITKAVILSEKADKEVERADDSEDIKEHVIEEESSTNELHLESKGDETTNEVEDNTSVSTECNKEADSNKRIEARESEVEENSIKDREASSVIKESEERKRDEESGETVAVRGENKEPEEKIEALVDESKLCQDKNDLETVTKVSAETSLNNIEVNKLLVNTSNISSETTEGDASQEIKELQVEEISSNLASPVPSDNEELEKQSLNVEILNKDEAEEIKRDPDAVHEPLETKSEASKTLNANELGKIELALDGDHVSEDKGIEQDIETKKSLAAEELEANEAEETKGVPATISDYLPQRVENIVEDEQKPEEQLQTSASTLPSEDEEIKTPNPIEKIEEEIEKDTGMVKQETTEDSSDTKTKEEVCLQKEEQREPKTDPEEETVDDQGLQKEEPEEQIQTASSTFPSEESKDAAEAVCEEKDVVTGDGIDGEQNLSANKPVEGTTSFAVLSKEQEEENISTVEKIDEEKLNEAEIPGDSSDVKKTAAIFLEKKIQELEDSKNDETAAARAIQVEEPNEQSFTSALHSENMEHGIKANEEEEEVKEVEMLEKERFPKPEVVVDQETTVAKVSITEETVEIETIGTIEKLDEEKRKEAENLEDEICEHSSARETEDICLQKEEPNELNAVPKEGITSGQTFLEQKSDEQFQISTSGITGEELEHDIEKTEDEETNKEQAMQDEISEDASDARKMEEICSQKERSIELDAVVEDEMTAGDTLTEMKSEELVQNPTSTLPSKEVEGGNTSITEEGDSEKIEEAEFLQEDIREDASLQKEQLQETDLTEETTLQSLEETAEPNNDSSLLDVVNESKEEITTIEAKEVLVNTSSFELEESKKDTEEETSVKESINTADLDSALTAVETEETNMKAAEAEPEAEEKQKEIDNILVVEESELATNEHEEIGVDSTDIDVKPADSFTSCKKEEIPQKEDGMQVKVLNAGSEHQIEMSTGEIPIKENSGDEVEECSTRPAEEYEPTAMEERKITDETSDKDQAPAEHSETPVSQAGDEILMQKEDNPVLDVPKAESGDGKECGEQPSDIGVLREKVEDGKPLDKAMDVEEASGISNDSKKAIQEEEILAENLPKPEGLEEDTELEREETELPRGTHDEIPEVANVDDNAKTVEIALAGFEKELRTDSEAVLEDQNKETFTECSKSQVDETSTDVQNQETEKQVTKELEDEDHVNGEQTANEVTKAVILSKEVNKEVEKVDDSEEIKERVIEEESSGNDFHPEPKEDETTIEVEGYTSVSTECLEEANSNKQIEARKSEVEELSTNDREASLIIKESEERRLGEESADSVSVQGADKESAEKIENIADESKLCQETSNTEAVTKVETSLNDMEIDKELVNPSNISSETAESDGNQETKELQLEEVSADLAPPIPTNDNDEVEKQSLELEIIDKDEAEVINRDYGEVYLSKDQIDEAERSLTVEKVDQLPNNNHELVQTMTEASKTSNADELGEIELAAEGDNVSEHKDIEQEAKTNKSLTGEELKANEVEETKGVPETSSNHLSQRVETVVDDNISSHNTLPKEKSEEQLQTSASTLPSEDENVKTPNSVEEIVKEIQEDNEDETDVEEGLQKEEAEKQIQTTSSKDATGAVSEELDVVTGDGITGEQTLSAYKPDEGTTSKVQEIDEEKINEAEIPENKSLGDSSDAKKTAEICSEKDDPEELEDATKDETAAAQTIQVEEPKEQCLTPALPSENIKHGTTASEEEEEEEVKGVEILEKEIRLEKERPQEPEAVEDQETTAAQASISEESVEIEAVGTGEKLDEEEIKEAENLEKEICKDSSAREIDDICLQKEEPSELNTVPREGTSSGQTLLGEKSDEQFQISTSGTTCEELEHETRKTEDEETTKDEIPEDASDARTMEEICSEKERFIEQEAVVEDEITAGHTLTEKKSEEQVENPTSALLSKEEECGNATEKIESGKIVEAEFLQDDDREDVSVQKEQLEQDKAKAKDENVSSQTLPVEKSEEKIPNPVPTLPSEEHKHESISEVDETEEEKVKEEEMQNEDSDGVKTVVEICSKKDETREAQAVLEGETVDSQVIAQEETQEDDKSRQSECAREIECALEDGATAAQTLSGDRQPDELHTRTSTLPSEEQQDETKETELQEDESPEKTPEQTREIEEASNVKTETNEKAFNNKLVTESEDAEIKEKLVKAIDETAGEGNEIKLAEVSKEEDKEVTETSHTTSHSEELTKDSSVEEELKDKLIEDKINEALETTCQNQELLVESQKSTENDIIEKQIVFEDKTVEDPGQASVARIEITTVTEEESSIELSQAEGRQIIDDIQQPEIRSNTAYDKQIPREIDPIENTEITSSIDKEPAPIDLQDSIADSSQKTEVGDVKEIYPKEAEVDHSGEKVTDSGQDLTKEFTSAEDSTKVSSSDDIESSKTETLQVTREDREAKDGIGAAKILLVEKSEERSPAPSSKLPSEEGEQEVSTRADEAKEKEPKEVEVLAKDSSDTKTEEHICLEKEENEELKAVVEQETNAAQALPTEIKEDTVSHFEDGRKEDEQKDEYTGAKTNETLGVPTYELQKKELSVETLKDGANNNIEKETVAEDETMKDLEQAPVAMKEDVIVREEESGIELSQAEGAQDLAEGNQITDDINPPEIRTNIASDKQIPREVDPIENIELTSSIGKEHVRIDLQGGIAESSQKAEVGDVKEIYPKEAEVEDITKESSLVEDSTKVSSSDNVESSTKETLQVTQEEREAKDEISGAQYLLGERQEEEQSPAPSSELPSDKGEHEVSTQVNAVEEKELKDMEILDKDSSDTKTREEICLKEEENKELKAVLEHESIAVQTSPTQTEEDPVSHFEDGCKEDEHIGDKTKESLKVPTYELKTEELSVDTLMDDPNNNNEKEIVAEDETVKDLEQAPDATEEIIVREEIPEEADLNKSRTRSSIGKERFPTEQHDRALELSQAEGNKDLAEGNQIIDDIQRPELRTNIASDKQIPREIYPVEETEITSSISKEHAPIDSQEGVEESSQKAEVGCVKEIYPKEAEVDHSGEKIKDNSSGDIIKESASVEDSTKVSSIDDVESSTKETLRATQEEREEKDETDTVKVVLVEQPEKEPEHEVSTQVDAVKEKEPKEVEILDKDTSDTKTGEASAVEAPPTEIKEGQVSHVEDGHKEDELKEEHTGDKTNETLNLPTYEIQKKEHSLETLKDGANNNIEKEIVAEDVTVKDLEQAPFGTKEATIVGEENPGEADPIESRKTSSIGKEHFPIEQQDTAFETSDKAEVGDLEPGSAQEICSEAVVDHGEEKKTDKSGVGIIQKPASPSDLLQRSTREKMLATEHVIEEKELTVSKDEPHVDEADTIQDNEAKTDEEKDGEERDDHSKTDSGLDAPVMVEAPRDTDTKPHKKSHNILSGVGSKVKHSISKVRKAITGKYSHSKESKSPKQSKSPKGSEK